ncbi:glycosyltransferase family 4 protein [Aeromonas media]|nr:glycosyltransferase family 4 protein [Aeromonas media]
MKIIYCIHGLKNSGGMERVITVKANYLAEHYGHEITIITLNSTDLSYFSLSDKIKIKAFDGSQLGQVVKFVNEIKPDIFISSGGKEIKILPYLSSIIFKVVEIHFCFQYPILREIAAGNNFFLQFYATLKLLRYMFYLNFANVVVSLTEKDSRKWQQCLFTSKVITIGNPVPHISHKQFLVQKKQDGHDINKFIAIGRLDNQKGFHDLIKICGLLVDKYSCSEWSLDIYGEGDLLQKLEKDILKSGLQDRVRILPPVSDLSDIYLNSKALLMTSYYEGMPMVMLEALSFGVPCISFDCDSGPSELLVNNVNGFLIKDRSCDEFAAKMKWFVESDHDKILEMRSESLRYIERYKIDKIMSKWDLLITH